MPRYALSCQVLSWEPSDNTTGRHFRRQREDQGDVGALQEYPSPTNTCSGVVL